MTLGRKAEAIYDNPGGELLKSVPVAGAAASLHLGAQKARTLRDVGEMARRRGALTVVVGIQPEVAFTMVRLGMDTGALVTALDLEEGIEALDRGLTEQTAVRRG